MQRKPQQRRNAVRNKKDSGTETSTASAKGSAANADEAEVEAIELITTMTEDLHETPGHHLPDAEAHLLVIAVLHPLDVKSTPTFLAAEAVVGQMRDGAGRRPQEDQDRSHIHDRLQELRHDEDTETTTRRDQGDGNTHRAELELPHAGDMTEVGKEEVSDAVMIEIDP